MLSTFVELLRFDFPWRKFAKTDLTTACMCIQFILEGSVGFLMSFPSTWRNDAHGCRKKVLLGMAKSPRRFVLPFARMLMRLEMLRSKSVSGIVKELSSCCCLEELDEMRVFDGSSLELS